MKCSYHPDIDAVDACTSCGKFICNDCREFINGLVYCHQCALKKNPETPNISGDVENKRVFYELAEFKPNWLQRHLNWTFIFTMIVYIGLIYGGGILTGFILGLSDPYVTDNALSSAGILVNIIIFACFFVPVCIWILDQKGRSLWWFLLLFFLSTIGIIIFLCLENRRIVKPENNTGTYFITRKSRINGKLVGIISGVIGGIIVIGAGIIAVIIAVVPDEPTNYVSMEEIETNPIYWNTDWQGMDDELEDKTYEVVDNYYYTHTYIEDETDCNDMAIDVWNMLHTEGIKSIIVIGNHDINNEPFSECDHAWLLVFDSEGYSFAAEITAGLVFFPEDIDSEPELEQYWEGFSYTRPSDLKTDIQWGW